MPRSRNWPIRIGIFPRVVISIWLISHFFLLGCSPSNGTKPIVPKVVEPESAPGSDATAKPASQAIAVPETKQSYEQRVQLAELKLRDSRVDEAWTIAKELMIERPDDPASIFIASRILASKKDLRSAIELISRIDPSDPKAGAAAQGQMSEWLAQTGDLARAERQLLTLLKSYPNAVPAIRLLIDIYSAQGRRWECSNLYDRLVRIGDFKEEELIKAIDFREPQDNQEFRAAALAFAPEEPLSSLGEIRLYTNKNMWLPVIDRLKEMVRVRPDLVEPWIWYGEGLLETGRIEELPYWLSIRPQGYDKHPEYWYIHGSMLSRIGKPEQSASCLVEAIRRDRRHVAATLQLAEVLLELGNAADAERVRLCAGKLVRINDLAQQIQRGYAKREAHTEIVKLFEELGDPIQSFAWNALLNVKDGLPLDDKLVAAQRRLRSEKLPEPNVLADLPVNNWPLPTDQEFQLASNQKQVSGDQEGNGSILMQDVAESMGIHSSYDNGAKPGRGWFTLEGIGGGVTAIDFDRDGWVDLYFSQAGDEYASERPQYKPKQLYRSNRAASFSEVSSMAMVGDLGYGQSVGTADLDQDGFSDLLVANVGSIEFYRNQGEGTFEKVELPQAGLNQKWNSSLQAADLNGDSLPDIVQGNYIEGDEVFTRWCQNTASIRGNCHPKRFPPGKSRILFNNGDGSWTLANQALLESLYDGYAFGALMTNIDQIWGNDVFIANDVSPNHLLLSRPGSKGQNELVECAAVAGVAVDSAGRAQACMGIACGDQNRDGLLDLIVTNYSNEVSTLYLQTAPGVFIDGTRRSNLGIHTFEWLSFGCQLADLDNDGWLDFITVNGHIDDLTSEGVRWKMPPQVLRNDNGKFNWLRSPSPGSYFDVDNVGRSLTAVDFNRDGQLDMVATHLDRPAALLVNHSPQDGNNYLQLELVGTVSERDAIGAIVHVTAGDQKWTVPVAVGDGFYGTNEHLTHIGLGRVNRIDSVRIVWPSGSTEEFGDLAINERYLIVESIGPSKVASVD